jgi:hypothetical protein
MNDRQNKIRRKMIGIMLEHDFIIKKYIRYTFVLTTRGFSGSNQMLLNTLFHSSLVAVSWAAQSTFLLDIFSARRKSTLGPSRRFYIEMNGSSVPQIAAKVPRLAS